MENFYYKFIGCHGCATGLALYEKYKRGELALTDKTPEAAKEETETKVCTRCGEEKPVHDFNNRAASPDGKEPQCKACKSKANKTYRDRHYVSVDGKRNGMRVILDFSRNPELYETIHEIARAEFRTPEMQVMFWLNQASSCISAKEDCDVSR